MTIVLGVDKDKVNIVSRQQIPVVGIEGLCLMRGSRGLATSDIVVGDGNYLNAGNLTQGLGAELGMHMGKADHAHA